MEYFIPENYLQEQIFIIELKEKRTYPNEAPPWLVIGR